MASLRFIPGFSEREPSNEVEGGIFNRIAHINLASDNAAEYLVAQYPDIINFAPEATSNTTVDAKVRFEMSTSAPNTQKLEQKIHLANGALASTKYHENEKARIEYEAMQDARQNVDQAFPTPRVFQDPHDSHTYGGMQ